MINMNKIHKTNQQDQQLTNQSNPTIMGSSPTAIDGNHGVLEVMINLWRSQHPNLVTPQSAVVKKMKSTINNGMGYEMF